MIWIYDSWPKSYGIIHTIQNPYKLIFCSADLNTWKLFTDLLVTFSFIRFETTKKIMWRNSIHGEIISCPLIFSNPYNVVTWIGLLQITMTFQNLIKIRQYCILIEFECKDIALFDVISFLRCKAQQMWECTSELYWWYLIIY